MRVGQQNNSSNTTTTTNNNNTSSDIDSQSQGGHNIDSHNGIDSNMRTTAASAGRRKSKDISGSFKSFNLEIDKNVEFDEEEFQFQFQLSPIVSQAQAQAHAQAHTPYQAQVLYQSQSQSQGPFQSHHQQPQSHTDLTSFASYHPSEARLPHSKQNTYPHFQQQLSQSPHHDSPRQVSVSLANEIYQNHGHLHHTHNTSALGMSPIISTNNNNNSNGNAAASHEHATKFDSYLSFLLRSKSTDPNSNDFSAANSSSNSNFTGTANSPLISSPNINNFSLNHARNLNTISSTTNSVNSNSMLLNNSFQNQKHIQNHSVYPFMVRLLIFFEIVCQTLFV
jgi:hypothetical protein